jgi:acyl-CoA thioesterase FadM
MCHRLGVHTYTRELGLADINAAARTGATTFDELPVELRHISFEKVVGFFGEVWIDFLRGTGDLLPTTAVGVVALTCEYAHEVKPGPAVGRLVVTRVGSSSFAFGLELHQQERVVATSTAVLVHKDFRTVRSLALDEDQRAFLASHRV